MVSFGSCFILLVVGATLAIYGVTADVDNSDLFRGKGCAMAGSATVAAVTENCITDDSDSVVETLYPAMTKDPSMPNFTTEYVYHLCDNFSDNRTAPPPLPGKDNKLQPTIANAIFAIDRLVDFEDVQETMKVSAMLWLHWRVPCPSKEGLLMTDSYKDMQRLFVSKKKDIAIPEAEQTLKDLIWLPSYIFMSSSSDIFMKSEEFGTDLVATGTRNKITNNVDFDFFYVRRGFYESQCSLSLAKFPFDSQSCNFSFAFQRSNNLIAFDSNTTVALCPSQTSTEWRFTLCKTYTRNTRLSGNNVSVADFVVFMSRIPNFYLINLALPSICLSLLELATYLMPPDKPDRPTFAVTIVLALTVAQSDVLKDVPKTSDRILLSDYILLLSWFSSLVTFYEMLACCLANYGEAKKFLKRQVKGLGSTTCSLVRALDIGAFSLSVAGYAGIQAYAAIIITK